MKEASNDRMVRAWWYLSNNFGDSINELLIRALSQKQLIASVDKSEPHYIVCGSILSEANKNSIVWGAGFSWEHHKKSDLYGCENVIAVRGDLSAERTGMEIKAIGDPALLLPMLYDNEKIKEDYIGVIPHWTNIEAAVERYPDFKIISPLLPAPKFIDSIRGCEYIFSESLHGLIVADAYGVSNSWIDLGANVGDGFKYKDYYSSTETDNMKAAKAISVLDCQVHKYKYNLQSLLNSCPFLWI
jgi:pyruvyltransferase